MFLPTVVCQDLGVCWASTTYFTSSLTGSSPSKRLLITKKRSSHGVIIMLAAFEEHSVTRSFQAFIFFRRLRGLPASQFCRQKSPPTQLNQLSSITVGHDPSVLFTAVTELHSFLKDLKDFFRNHLLHSLPKDFSNLLNSGSKLF